MPVCVCVCHTARLLPVETVTWRLIIIIIIIIRGKGERTVTTLGAYERNAVCCNWPGSGDICLPAATRLFTMK